MKKKLLLIIGMVLTVSFMYAGDMNILALDFQPWGNTQFDVATKKITWTQEWEGGGWWLALDCSKYDSATIEFKEKISMDVIITIIYSAIDERNERLKSKKIIPAGANKMTIALDPTYKISVDGIGISGSKAGSVILKSLILKETDVNE